MTPAGHINTITDLTTGKDIKEGTKCIVVLDAFITTGGDGYDAGLFCKPIDEFNRKNLEPTVVFIDYLRNLGQSVSTKKAPLPKVSTKK